MRWRGGPSEAPLPRTEHGGHPLRDRADEIGRAITGALSLEMHKRSDKGTDHAPQEGVGGDLVDEGIALPAEGRLSDATPTAGRLVLGRGERGEVPFAEDRSI